MTQDEAREGIARLEPRLRRLGVRSVAIFGSVLRNEASEASDLDLVALSSLPTPPTSISRRCS